MNIFLIGMSGAGKSTLGVLLAKALCMEFVDTDLVIQNSEERLLQEIIDAQGLAAFLTIEERVLSGLQLSNCVVATGGSVVYSEKLMAGFKRKGQVIFLQVRLEEIEKRIKNMTSRGIVLELYDERVPLYRRYSDKIIDCSDLDVEESVTEMIRVLGK
jgi:shikimate kinase